jgi:hypothetical protein
MCEKAVLEADGQEESRTKEVNEQEENVEKSKDQGKSGRGRSFRV